MVEKQGCILQTGEVEENQEKENLKKKNTST